MHASPAPQPTLLRTTALVGLAALLSRVLGFVRDMTMAWLLGNSLAADALVMALRLPHVLRRLLGEGALSMSLTADFVHGGHGISPQSPAPPLALARAVGLRLALILAVAVLLGEILARPLAALLAPGQAHDAALMDRAVPLLRLCLPYAFTAGMAALGMALLHSMGRFLLPALLPALFNITVLGFAALAALQVAPAAWLLAMGVCCGGLVQWLAQAVALRVHLPAAPEHPKQTGQPKQTETANPDLARPAWRCLAHLPGAVLGAAAPQLAMLGGMIVASWLPQGSVAALYYAERLLELPLGVAGAALGIASLPALSRLAAAGQHHEFTKAAQQALHLSLCATLPATAGLLAVATPLVQTLFARGAFEANAVQATVLALAGYAPGLPAYGLTRPLLAVCQACRHPATVRACALSGVAAVLAALLIGVGLTHTLPPGLALLGPPLGVSGGLWVQTALLFRAARTHMPVRLDLHAGSLAQQGLASLLTGLTAWVVTLAPLPAWLCLGLAVPAGVTVYALALWAMGNAQFKDILAQRRVKA